MKQRLLNYDEAAEYLTVSRRTIWTLGRTEIPTVRIGRCVRFDVSDLDAFIEAQKEKADAV